MTEKRTAKFRRVASRRQPSLTVILENVHDPHNISAVLRTSDSVGVPEIYVLNTEAHLQNEALYISKRASTGARKWVKINFFTDRETCFKVIRSKYDHIWATHLSEDARDLYQLDLTESVALLFGNEHEGISQESLAYTDGNFLIPQMGMVESLNISVACAVTLYEALRQRSSKGYYSTNLPLTEAGQESLFKQYVEIHTKKKSAEYVPKVD